MADPTDPTSSSGLRRLRRPPALEAEAPSLRAIAVEHPVELRRLEHHGTVLVHLRRQHDFGRQRGTILRIESVLDRLALISRPWKATRAPPM